MLNSGDLWRTQAGDGQPARYGFSRVPSPESRSDALTGPYAASENAAAFGDGGGGGLCRGDYIKMRSFEGPLIQYDWCPCRKRNVDKEPRREKAG